MLTILHTNDFHGTLDEKRASFINRLKLESGALYFDSGDCIKAGNLAIPLKPEPAWSFLHDAGCDASTLGNRETHVLEKGFLAKIAGAEHPLVCANIRFKSHHRPLLPAHFIEKEGFRIGIVGVMVPMVTERMASRHASAYIWEAPIPVAKQLAEVLRPQVDCLIALTHIGHRQDLELASSCPLLDLILGGHSHTVLEEPVRVGDTFICQGGSHGRFIGKYRWSGRGTLEGGLIRLDGSQ